MVCSTLILASVVLMIFGKGLRPYYIISYNKQGSFQMITDDYNMGPRVVRKDYVLWKIQNMPSFSVAHSSLVLRMLR